MSKQLRSARHESRAEVFHSRGTRRELRILIDAQILDPEEPGTFTPMSLLQGLMTSESIYSLSYAEQGLPAHVPRLVPNNGDQAYAIGWVVAKPTSEDDGWITHDLIWADENVVTYGAIAGNIVDFLGGKIDADAYRGLDPSAARERREADAIAAACAREIKADIFVTTRPLLNEINPDLFDGITFCTPQETLEIVSLYLRSQDQYLSWVSSDGRISSRLGRSYFYLVGARELLPSNWRWAAACWGHDQAHGTDELSFLVRAVFQRVAQALRARDDLLRLTNIEREPDVSDDIATSLDSLLLFLMGAVDSAARIAHLVTKLPGPMRNAGWQYRPWRKELATIAPDLAAIVEPHSEGSDALTILRLLRNSVHSESLGPIRVTDPSRRRNRTVVGLPRSDLDEILQAAQRTGGPESWGLTTSFADQLPTAEPRALVDRLVPTVLRVLDSLIAHTPVDGLPGIDPGSLEQGVPAGQGELFEERNRLSVRWQLGL